MPSILTVSVDGVGEYSHRFEDKELIAVEENYGREKGVGFLVEQVLTQNGIKQNGPEPLTLAFEFKEVKTLNSIVEACFASVRTSSLVRRVKQQVRGVMGS